MSELFKKIKSLLGRLNISHPSYSKGGIRPKNDWKILFIISQIIIFIMASFSFYLYVQINRGTIFIVTLDSKVGEVNIKTDLLKKVVDDIDAREVNSNLIKKNKLNVPDPSI